MFMRVSNLFLFLLISLFSVGQSSDIKKIPKLEIPALKSGEVVITHLGYSLSYNEVYEQANWVAYELTADETVARVKRNNKFITDPNVKTGTAENADYLHSNLDRGHLAPAGDMCWSQKSMEESFYLSNISPQVPTFNRGIWENFEELVRKWAVDYGSVYVVTGPVLSKGLPVIGKNKIAVPKYFFKVVLDYNGPEVKGLGFLVPNDQQHKDIKSYLVSIDSIEKVTGINFFPLLPDKEENIIEGKVDARLWKLNTAQQNHFSQIKAANKKQVGDRVTSTQCNSLTKKGLRCKNMTKNANGRCYLHQ